MANSRLKHLLGTGDQRPLAEQVSALVSQLQSLEENQDQSNEMRTVGNIRETIAGLVGESVWSPEPGAALVHEALKDVLSIESFTIFDIAQIRRVLESVLRNVGSASKNYTDRSESRKIILEPLVQECLTAIEQHAASSFGFIKMPLRKLLSALPQNNDFDSFRSYLRGALAKTQFSALEVEALSEELRCCLSIDDFDLKKRNTISFASTQQRQFSVPPLVANCFFSFQRRANEYIEARKLFAEKRGEENRLRVNSSYTEVRRALQDLKTSLPRSLEWNELRSGVDAMLEFAGYSDTRLMQFVDFVKGQLATGY
ncbi:MAG: hypothetical protein ABL890_04815 [Candidatus Peribacteraceae bacterium]